MGYATKYVVDSGGAVGVNRSALAEEDFWIRLSVVKVTENLHRR